MKITTIYFSRHNPWGTSDYATHYYVDGKRISAKRIVNYEYYALTHLRHERTEEKTIVKDGISRDYTIAYYGEKFKA